MVLRTEIARKRNCQTITQWDLCNITGDARMAAFYEKMATVKLISSLKRRYGYGLHEKID